MATPQFCSECGTLLKEAARFCSECGHSTPVPAAEPKPAAESKLAAASKPEPAAKPAATGPAAEPASADDGADHHHAQHTGGFVDPIAALLGANPEEDDEAEMADSLTLPDADGAKAGKRVPVGVIAVSIFVLVMVAMTSVIATNDELSARFQCQVLKKRDMCVTEADHLFEIQQQKKKEELALMGHHYATCQLGFAPEKETSFTLRQRRYEESRDEFIKRVREGTPDNRTLKEVRVGTYEVGKSAEGVTKGRIRLAAGKTEGPTYEPNAKKELILPIPLNELPLLEREQVIEGTGRRLSIEELTALEEKVRNPTRDAEGRVVAEAKIETQAMSTYLYEIEFSAKGFYPRKVLFYEDPPPPDVDLKALKADETMTLKPFKRRPDGIFTVDSASFDLLPEPRTIQTRYMQVLKEIHCLKKSKEFEGKSEQGKADAEALIWEQKAFTEQLQKIALENEQDEEFLKLKEETFKTYQCPEI